MAAFILLTIIVVVVVLVAKAVHEAQRTDTPESATVAKPRTLRSQHRPARRRPQASSPPVDEQALAEHVRKLQEAIGGGLVTTDEAVASICRSTHGVLSEEAARELLRRRGAA